MQQLIENIRRLARRLLEDGQVEAVYGFAKPTVPLACRPFVARTPEQAGELWWDEFCVMNLANFVPRRAGFKFAVVAKGCDSRNLVVLHQETQLDMKEQVRVIGVPCQGMIDRRLIHRSVPLELISQASVADGQVVVEAQGQRYSFRREEVTRETCRSCRYPSPVVECEMAGEPIPADPGRDKDARVREIEALDPASRQEFFRKLFEPCIRCYACRDACPLCYCHMCFVDESKPQWLAKSAQEGEVLTYHFLRAFHCAGRCTDCGACESACPVDIPMRLLTRKLEKDIQAAYGHQAGLSLDVAPPMNVFRPDDPENFLRK